MRFSGRGLFSFYLRSTATEEKNLIVIVFFAKRKWLGWQTDWHSGWESVSFSALHLGQVQGRHMPW